jgi:hypothetical protein
MPRATTKHDYLTLERLYREGNMSIRELCRENGIASWSAVSAHARKNGWDEQRATYRQRLREKETALVTQKIAEVRADIVEKAMTDAVTIANKAMFTFLDSLEDRWVEDPSDPTRKVLIPAMPIPASDFVKIMQAIMVLNGQPTKREAHMGLNLSGEMPEQMTMEFLRDIAAAARAQGARVSGESGSSPLPRSERARKVN